MEAKEIKLQDTTSNPAPLGLLGFGMTTILLNLHNAGFYPMDSMVLSMGIFYGGIAQIIAGVMEWKKNNTFGAVAFTSYGLFWLSLVNLLVMPKFGWMEKASKEGMIAYFLLWGIFTLCMLIGTFKKTRSLQFVFASLTILFFLLAIRDITGNALIATITGIEGILCGASAFYAAIVEILDEMNTNAVE